MIKKLTDKLTYIQIIILSFLLVIFIGTILLMLPLSSRTGQFTPFINALFTAVSSTCVTGLVVYDTFTHYTAFGQAVILVMIQIGGLGLMSCISMGAFLLKRRIGITERRLIMETTGAESIGGVVKRLKRILFITFGFEFTGALILFCRFIRHSSFTTSLKRAVFHSVSAFCNAGFDIMGENQAFSSLSGFNNDTVIISTVSLLIIIGGLGFMVWDDIGINFKRPKHFSVQTKTVLLMSAVLIAFGTVCFLLFDYNGALNDLSFGEKVINAFFQSVTARTAGFNSVDLGRLSQPSLAVMIALMFIGAGPASTGGGIKITTFYVLLMNIISPKNNGDTVIFKRKIPDNAIKKAAAVVTLYIMLCLCASVILCASDNVSLTQAVFETVSAVATVGLTLGITPTLGTISKIALIVLMFCGRIGGVAISLSFLGKKTALGVDRPEEKILIG